MKSPTQAYNDGRCAIYKVTNGGPAAGKPSPVLSMLYRNLRYAERTVGIKRYWEAHQHNAQIDKLIRAPRRPDISPQEIVELEDGVRYKIVQVQYIPDVNPPSMDLSLQRREETFDAI